MKCLIVALCLGVLSRVDAAPATLADEISWRLSGSSKPLSYNLNLVTNIHDGDRSFNGWVEIVIEITEATSVVTLHNRDLSLSVVSLLRDGIDIVADYSVDATRDFLMIATEEELQVGEQLTLEIMFSGNMQSQAEGLFRTSYAVDGISK